MAQEHDPCKNNNETTRFENLQSFFDQLIETKLNQDNEKTDCVNTLQYFYKTPASSSDDGVKWVNEFVAVCPFPDSTPFIEKCVVYARETVEKICPGTPFFPMKEVENDDD